MLIFLIWYTNLFYWVLVVFFFFKKGILSMLNIFCINEKNDEVLGEKMKDLSFQFITRGSKCDFLLSEEKEKLCHWNKGKMHPALWNLGHLVLLLLYLLTTVTAFTDHHTISGGWKAFVSWFLCPALVIFSFGLVFCLQLLGELLLDRHNFTIMTK